MRKLILLMLLAVLGCGETSTPAIPPIDDTFVKNDNGVGTARVFGIDFNARTHSSGASNEFAIDANFVDAEDSSAMVRFTLGDDITIQLDSIDESEVRFLFNDQDFGTLNVGDKVNIDDDRNIEVNGTSLSPKSEE